MKARITLTKYQEWVKAQIHGATLRAMPELHRVSTPKFVARNIACNIAAVESRPTSATLRATNFFVYPPSAAFHAIVWCKFQCSAKSNLTFKFNRWPNFRPWYVSRKRMVWSAEEESSLLIDYYRGKWSFFLILTCGLVSKHFVLDIFIHFFYQLLYYSRGGRE